MNTLDWECPKCNSSVELSGYTSAAPPFCEACDVPREIAWKTSRMSAWERPWKYWNEEGKECVASSIADVRRFERDQERRVANGESSQLMVATQFSQDRSNRGSNVFAVPHPKANPFTRTGRRLVTRRGGGPGDLGRF